MNNQGGENTEVEYKPEESSDKQLADFKETMREFKRQEELVAKLAVEGKQKFTSATWHFGEVNPDELTEEDMGMWEVVKTNLITSKSKDDERNRIPADTLLDIFKDYKANVKRSGNSSREQFAAFIANKIGGPIGYEYVRRSDV
jgi:hypothetical protein